MNDESDKAEGPEDEKPEDQGEEPEAEEPGLEDPETPEETREESPAESSPEAGTGEPAARSDSPEDPEEKSLPAGHYHVVPVRNMVLFPGVVLPLMIGRPRSIRAIQEAVRTESSVALLLQREESVESPVADDLFSVGTIAEVVRYIAAEDGRHHAICQGQQRCRVVEWIEHDPLPIARVEIIEEVDPDPDNTDIEARFLALKSQAVEVLQLAPGAPEDLSNAVEHIGSPAMLSDMIATFMDVPVEERQEVLETFDVLERLSLVALKLGHVAEVLRLSKKIRDETQGTLEQAQREYYLREQLRAIQRELGESDDKSKEVAGLDEAISEAKMPEEVEKEARKELTRLERMPDGAAEASIIRTYLEVMTELPWSKTSEDRLDIVRAAEILDEDHHGLKKVKQRIIEFLAVRQLKPEGKSQNLCLVGPPGVGKTSLGKSVARAMEREFVRTSLGGVHDEAEIRGHRRTYVGALPGNILQGLRKAGTCNPVFMLDEMDKLGRGMHGDPSSALLEVLDPEQNHTFRDNYLVVPFDLHRVLFIGTANVLEAVPPPLRDRFEVIHLPGYTREEKLQIAIHYLVQRRLEDTGLTERQCSFTPEALDLLIRSYTREAGVRGLERCIGAICRHVATRIVEKSRRSMKIRPAQVRKILGPLKYESELAKRCNSPGIATGLVWTPVGGEIIFIEVTAMSGKGRLIMTGQLGDVMKESAQAALSLVRTRAERLGIDPDVFERKDLHLHIPAGAIPKDGPSAGVGLYTAMVSFFTGQQVRNEVAMTGEISLRGLVLPIGGVKEKVLGALAAGIEVVILPRRNEVDLLDIPEDARKQLEFHFVENVDQVLELAMAPAGGEKRKKKASRVKKKAGVRKKKKSKARRE